MPSFPKQAPPPAPAECRADVPQAPWGALPRHWPFGELTEDQQHQQARFEAAARAGTLRQPPTEFGELA